MVESNSLEEPWVRPEPEGDKFALPVGLTADLET